MPNSVEDVRFRIERVREKEGVSEPVLEGVVLPLPLLLPAWVLGSSFPSKWTGLGEEESGGEADVRRMLKGRRGIGRMSGGEVDIVCGWRC
jgi:hypothetical protein